MTSTPRNVMRSEMNRHFVGSVVMVLEEQRRWAQLFSDSLTWILELEGHPQFMRVLRTLYTEKYGSVYAEAATVGKVKDLLAGIDIITFRHKLFVAADLQDDEEPQFAPERKEMVSSPSLKQLEVDVIKPEELFACNVLHSEGSSFLDGFGTVAIPESTPDVATVLDQDQSLHWNEEIVEKIATSENLPEDKKWMLINYDSEGVAHYNVSQLLSLTMGHDKELMKNEKLRTIIINNDVYFYGERVYGHLTDKGSPTVYDRFPVVIYAYPGSGKTFFNKSVLHNRARDTDQMLYWEHYSPIVLTNMSQYLRRALYSIALIPSRHMFKRRCRSKGLQPLDSWYDDMLRDVGHAKFKMCSDRFLGEAFLNSEESRRLMKKCRASVESLPTRALWTSWQLYA